MKVRVLDRAENDLTDGFWFYENQQADLGRYFLEQLYTDIAALEQFGGIHRIVFHRFQRRLSRRFPFAIYYRVEAETLPTANIAALFCGLVTADRQVRPTNTG